MKRSRPHRSPSLRLLITAGWLTVALSTVVWFRPAFWRGPAPPAPVSRPFASAQALAEARRPAEALVAIDEALVAEPGNAGYLVFKAYRFVDLARRDEAEATFRQAIALQPAGAEASLGLADTLAAQSRHDEAMTTLQGMRAADLTNEQLHRRVGMYTSLSAFALGLDDVKILLAAAPNDGALLDEASTLAIASRDWVAAASLSERQVSASDDPVVKRQAMNRLATALRSSGRIEEAYADYKRAPGQENLEARADLALQLGDFAGASTSYRTLVAAHPMESRLRARLAYALDRASRRGEAETVYRGLVKDGTADTATRVRYAWLLNGSHRYAEAWQALAPVPSPSTDLQVLDVQARTAVWAREASASIPLIRRLLEVRPQDAELWKMLVDSHRALSDLPSSADALRSYVRLNSQDWKARQDLADLLARLGSVGEAIAEYRALVSTQPAEPGVFRALGLLLETDGRLTEAIPMYVASVDSARQPEPELWLRLARLHRWTSHPVESLTWYERYVAGVSDATLRRRAEGELAVALLESGRPAESLAHVESLDREAPLGEDDLLTGARGETALERPALAAHFLERLSKARPLERAERVWLAGQLRSAGNTAQAGDLFDQLARDAPDGEVLEAAADLHADRGDPRTALELYRSIRPIPQRITLKIARAAAATGSRDLASRGYQDYLSDSPQDVDAQLEAARFFARTNQPHLALPFYSRVVSARGSEALRLELARVELEGQHFPEAEQWAREALAAGEDPDNATVALGQSLHLQGRNREARETLGPLIGRAGDRPEALPWLGYTAIARNRLLEGYQWFERALAANVHPAGDVWMGRGEAATKRGDYARAADSYAQALAAGADTLVVGAARDVLDASTLPRVDIPVSVHGDTNDLRTTQSGVSAQTLLPGDRARVRGEILQGDVQQHTFKSSRTVGSLSMDRLFVTPRLELQGAIGQERYDAASRATGRVAARYSFSDAATVGLNINRESLLSTRDSHDPREFNRIVDLAGLGSDLGVSRAEGHVDVRDQADRFLHGTGGEEWYEDGNRRRFLYVHYQVPVKMNTTYWIVIRPNAYVEHFGSASPFYFSPQSHVTIGTMVHAVVTHPRWTIEAEVNPQILKTDGAIGVGAHGMTSLSRRFGPVVVGGDAFVFYDDLVSYRHWRLGAHISIPLSR